MGVTLWIVVAFALGVLFGRLTARGSAGNAGGPTGIGSATGPIQSSGRQFGPGAPAQVAGNPNGAYRLTLVDSGPNKINTIKAVRSVTRLDLKGAKDLVDSAPSEITRVDSAEQAQAIVRAFQGVATVRLDGPAGGTAQPEYGYAPSGGSQPYN
ncbi:ribosomal protein L7/L12 [Terriglobus sp.]|uniref:ribosomal protein L7/L12 n=1 Tax=Terriglobus sp. TaxID=1889013 RepID=UPI003AFFA377